MYIQVDNGDFFAGTILEALERVRPLVRILTLRGYINDY